MYLSLSAHLPFSRTRGLLGRRHGNVSHDQAGAPSFIHLRREIVELKILFIVLNDAHNETTVINQSLSL